jgi:hypothetical protein
LDTPESIPKPTSGPDATFAPGDLTDGRRPGEWRSRYEAAAWKHIWVEASYLLAIMVVTLALLLLTWLKYFQAMWHLTPEDATTFGRYMFCWLGGTLGGTLFAMKWHYHSVAKLLWHLDRRLWRYLTPHISGGLAFASLAVIQSFGGSGSGFPATNARALAVGFLIGFFSDNALAKLAEIAETLLGPTKRHPADVRKTGSDGR